MTSPRKMMGFENPGDVQVRIRVREWDGAKLALWRSLYAWEIAATQAVEILQRCGHMEGCPGKTEETEPCLKDCPDREIRMSALVILNAARQFAPIHAIRPADQPYYAPTREYFSEVYGLMLAGQTELASLRGSSITPPQNEDAPKALPEKI